MDERRYMKVCDEKTKRNKEKIQEEKHFFFFIRENVKTKNKQKKRDLNFS